MQAVILAAGMGSRLKKITENQTKCMVEVNGQSIIERLLLQLDKKNLNRIVIVVGYRADDLKNEIESLHIKTKIEYVLNDIYNETNNIYSFYLAKDYLLTDDTILFESDLVFEDSVIDELIASKSENIALVDKYQTWMEGTCLKISQDGTINDFIPGKQLKREDINEYYKTVNTYKFSKEFMKKWYIPFLEAYMGAIGVNEYYEQVLKVILFLDNQTTIKALNINGKLWYEIDDAIDLSIAELLFNKAKAAILKMENPKVEDNYKFVEHYKL